MILPILCYNFFTLIHYLSMFDFRLIDFSSGKRLTPSSYMYTRRNRFVDFVDHS